MRCSSCEPRLDAFIEGTLRADRARAVATHLAGCAHCSAFLSELRVIDALLATARPPGRVGADFTAAVVSATPAMPPLAPRRVPIWAPVLAYLAVAWFAGALAALRWHALGAPFYALEGWAGRAAAALSAAFRALAPATPIAAAAVGGILLADLLLLCAVLYAYRRLRPLLSVYLARGPRT